MNPQLFLKLTVASPEDFWDPVLDLEVYDTLPEECVIGLPSIDLFQMYLIPVVKSGEGHKILLRQKDDYKRLGG